MIDLEKNMLLMQWLRLHLKQESLSGRIYEKGYKNIAICGFREYGRLLVEELKTEGMEIICIIEKNYQSLQVIDENIDIPIVGFSEKLDSNGTDVIIVTPDLDIAQVRENLEMAGVRVPLIGLDQILL